jgi:hypothetical protein
MKRICLKRLGLQFNNTGALIVHRWDEPEAVIASSHSGETNRQLTDWIEHNGCAASATRRAIVRAAAEIGRALPS